MTDWDSQYLGPQEVYRLVYVLAGDLALLLPFITGGSITITNGTDLPITNGTDLPYYRLPTVLPDHRRPDGLRM